MATKMTAAAKTVATKRAKNPEGFITGSVGNTVTVPFTFEKETPNTYRFHEDGTGPNNRGLVGTIYVHKATFQSRPERIAVTITVRQ
jgi:hypothetical protein